ncbi:MAG: hypothetical protein PHU29_00500 [Sulfuricurvum sp.]|nr:hypothetical protein [Sulfuricurvum sp.]MDD2949243.1 hypothetical protein [Sulfuricurvum sp.]MDD5119189.1 hypothetical protein [Sulfuricurvum sp.]
MANKKAIYTGDGLSKLIKANNSNLERGMSGVTKSNQAGSKTSSDQSKKS